MSFLRGFGRCCGCCSGGDDNYDEHEIECSRNELKVFYDNNAEVVEISDNHQRTPVVKEPSKIEQTSKQDCYSRSNNARIVVVDHDDDEDIDDERQWRYILTERKRATLYNSKDILQKVLRFECPVKIGSGAFGKVYRAAYRAKTDEELQIVAIKTYTFECIEICGFKWQSYIEEVQKMRSIDHPNIVKFINNFQVYHDANHSDTTTTTNNNDKGFIVEENKIETMKLSPNLKLTAIVMDHLGPDLLQFKMRNFLTCFREPLLRVIFEQVGSALVYLHGCHKLAHQDVKEDNIVFAHASYASINMDQMDHSNVQMKLVDFGNARYEEPPRLVLPPVGCTYRARARCMTHYDTDTIALGRFLIQNGIPNAGYSDPLLSLVNRFTSDDPEQLPKSTIQDEKFRSVIVQMTNQQHGKRITMPEVMALYYESNPSTESPIEMGEEFL